MKQSAAKTLGAAALGAAFAAVAAGSASAAEAAPALPDPGQALDTVNQTLPAENVSQSLPGADEALEQGKHAVDMGLEGAQPVTGLLGGVPVQELPVHATPVNGIPLG